jgi:hypothetical protein
MRNQELLNVIDLYFDAIYHCDVTILDTVFHKDSSLFDVDEGHVFSDPIASFRKNVGSRPSPASIQQKRQEEIIMIDWLSKNCAIVKLRLRAHNNIFVDHLSLVKADNEDWKIVAKVWHLESIVEAA